jgi:CheY-like chemotaxis protein
LRKKRILACDDNEAITYSYRWCLAEAGYDAVAVNDGGEALDLLRTGEFDLLIQDLTRPFGSLDGIQLLHGMGEEGMHHIPVLICTAYFPYEPEEFFSTDPACNFKTIDLLEKPAGDVEFRHTIEGLFERAGRAG